MPTKAMLASAHAVHEANHLESFGARLEGRIVPDFGRIMERKARFVERFQKAKIAGVEAQDYEVRFGRARFSPDGGVKVDGAPLAARRYIVATGSVPDSFPIPGLNDVPVLTSDDVMRLERQPESVLVQGAGPIALELAQFFARIGTRVFLVNRSPLLSRFDSDCGNELARALAAEPNLDLATPGRIEELRPAGDGLVASVRSRRGLTEVEADFLLMAVGRRPAIDDLGLEHVGVEFTGNGLRYDENMRTDHPDVYVAGDSTGIFQVLHIANQEGAVAGFNAAGGRPERRMDYRLKMGVVFTDPPFALVGSTESEAAACGLDVAVGQARFSQTGRAITMGAEYGVWKLIVDKGSGEILGSTILGPRADDLIHLIAQLMHFRGTLEDVTRLPWYHPTLSEVMLSLARSAGAEIP